MSDGGFWNGVDLLRDLLTRGRHRPTAAPTAKISGRTKASVGIVAIGQSSRGIARKWQSRLGSDVQILMRGALDGLNRAEIDKLAPGPGDSILVTGALSDGSPAFVARRHIISLVQERIEEVERLGAAFTVLLCTGKFSALRATRPLVQPDKILRRTLRGMETRGPVGVLTPSAPQVSQTEARWRHYDPVVVPLSLDKQNDATSVDSAIAALKAGGVALVVLDCMGFRNSTGERIRSTLRVPVLFPNRLIAQVAAELLQSNPAERV
jgi:protein AroM